MWITPDPTDEVNALLERTKADPKSFLIIEGKPAAGETDAEIVAAAWDFERINRRHGQYLTTLKRPLPPGPFLVEWIRRENAAWRAAVCSDPLLPAELLPPGYRGRETVRARFELFAQLSRTRGET